MGGIGMGGKRIYADAPDAPVKETTEAVDAYDEEADDNEVLDLVKILSKLDEDADEPIDFLDSLLGGDDEDEEGEGESDRLTSNKQDQADSKQAEDL